MAVFASLWFIVAKAVRYVEHMFYISNGPRLSRGKRIKESERLHTIFSAGGDAAPGPNAAALKGCQAGAKRWGWQMQ